MLQSPIHHKKHLVVFAEDFNGLPSSSQHLVKRLANDRKVLWINSIGLRQPKFNLADLSRACKKVQQGFFNTHKTPPTSAFNQQAKVHKNIKVMTALTLPAPQSNFARQVARLLLTRQVKQAISHFIPQDEAYDLWLSLPTAADLIGHLGEDKVIYYCGDDFSALAGVDHKTVAQHEERLVAKADLILAASHTLTHKFPSKKSHCIEHGVDLSLFNQPTTIAPELAAITENKTRPCAGFYGSISEWLDQDLIANTAKQLPHWQFVFIGDIHVNIDRLKGVSNIHFITAKAHHQLPQFSQHWTASLLPFHLNEQIQACNPLKLTEYLAAGQPIITTPFNAVKKYQGFVQLVSTPEQMVKALQASETQQEKAITDSLKNAVSHLSWAKKSQQVDKLLEAI